MMRPLLYKIGDKLQLNSLAMWPHHKGIWHQRIFTVIGIYDETMRKYQCSFVSFGRYHTDHYIYEWAAKRAGQDEREDTKEWDKAVRACYEDDSLSSKEQSELFIKTWNEHIRKHYE